MEYGHIDEVKMEKVDVAKNTYIQWLITKEDGAPHFAMRRFVVKKAGNTPYHSHAHEHEVFVLSGNGKAIVEGEEFSLEPGSFILVKPEKTHQFINTGEDDLVFLCIVPISRQ